MSDDPLLDWVQTIGERHGFTPAGETCEPVRPSEVVAGAASAQSSYGDITHETAPTFDRWQENAKRHRDVLVELIGERSWEEFHRSCDTLRAMWRDGLLGYGVVEADKAQ